MKINDNTQSSTTNSFMKVKLDSGRKIVVAMKDCEKMITTGPRQLRRRSSSGEGKNGYTQFENNSKKDTTQQNKLQMRTKHHNSNVPKSKDPRGNKGGILKRKFHSIGIESTSEHRPTVRSTTPEFLSATNLNNKTSPTN